MNNEFDDFIQIIKTNKITELIDLGKFHISHLIF